MIFTNAAYGGQLEIGDADAAGATMVYGPNLSQDRHLVHLCFICQQHGSSRQQLASKVGLDETNSGVYTAGSYTNLLPA